MKVIMISGPYRNNTECGLEDNIRHAESAAKRFWKEGWAVFCPHMNTARFGGLCDDSVWLEGDLEFLKRCDAIYMLNTWRNSEGAKIEHQKAIEWGKQILYETD